MNTFPQQHPLRQQLNSAVFMTQRQKHSAVNATGCQCLLKSQSSELQRTEGLQEQIFGKIRLLPLEENLPAQT